MGAAGSVTIYRRSDAEAAYERLWPGESLTEDWDYVDTITAELDGERWILDYADDQGMHEGSGNFFWFGGEIVPKDEARAMLPTEVNDVVLSACEDVSWLPRRTEEGPCYYSGQVRALAALRCCERQTVEVWT